jgi:inorganic pyrophosphatase
MRRASLAALLLLAVSAPLAHPAPPAAGDHHPRFGSAEQRLEYLLAPGLGVWGYTVVDLRNWRLDYLRDFPALNADGSVNAVVEIPAGDNRKFETDPATGRMAWELKDGVPRVVAYLGYPGNYGAVPRTRGGDGDPLDILTLGRMDLRGAVVPAKVIGAIRLVDDGEIDDKLIAVLPGTALADVDDMAELDERFPGISQIVATWLVSYKGPGKLLEFGGFVGAAEARQILDEAIAAF